jgi:predicted nucleic acid-binding protein
VTDFVLDASIALAWCFEDETTAATQRILGRLATEAASVPAIWPLDVANALTTAERRRRITRADSAEFIATLESLIISVDEETASLGFTRILNLAREEKLTAYDAAYLELPMRLGVPLASKDGPLCDAAERVGVTVLRAG